MKGKQTCPETEGMGINTQGWGTTVHWGAAGWALAYNMGYLILTPRSSVVQC